MNKLVRRLLDTHYQHADADTVFSVQLLYYIQLSLVVFLMVVTALVATLTPSNNRIAYAIIAGCTLFAICSCMGLTLNGHYRTAFWGTVALMFLAPWVSVLYEYFQHSGDYVPMMYLIIPIHITAMFVKVRPLYWIAALQTVVLTLLVLSEPQKSSYNWISVICFVFIASVLSTLTSYVLRGQYERLIRNRNDLVRSEQRMRDISIRDPLTGLFNRRHMDEAFMELFERSSPLFSLLMVDVDHFKDINDTYGHSCGDEIIQKVASILTTAIRKYDVACRYGGDEFLLILSDCDYENALIKAHKIKQEIENVVVDPEADIQSPLTASIGVAQCPLNGDNRDAILKAVDDALYQAKQGGRNRVVAAEGVYTAAIVTPHVR